MPSKDVASTVETVDIPCDNAPGQPLEKVETRRAKAKVAKALDPIPQATKVVERKEFVLVSKASNPMKNHGRGMSKVTARTGSHGRTLKEKTLTRMKQKWRSTYLFEH